FPLAGIESVTMNVRVNSLPQRRFVGAGGEQPAGDVLRFSKDELGKLGPRTTNTALGSGDYIYVDDQQRFTVEFVPQAGTDSDTNGICRVRGLKAESVETFGPVQTKLPDMMNHLLLNDGNGEFRDVTAESGAGESRSTRQSVLADFDNDGDLDIFVLN